MAWIIEYSATAVKSLQDIDKGQARRILKYMKERVAQSDDPRAFGKALTSNLSGFWRYRVGDYRVIAEIQNERVVVLVLRVSHRKDVYGGH